MSLAVQVSTEQLTGLLRPIASLTCLEVHGALVFKQDSNSGADLGGGGARSEP